MLGIDSVQPELKVVMLQNGNILALIPFCLAVHMKKVLWQYETTKSMINLTGNIVEIRKLLLSCQDCKMNLPNNVVFLCEWDNRVKRSHYINRKCPLCQSFQP